MAKGICRLAALGLLAFAAPGLAATLIEFRDDDGDTSRVWIEGDTARLEDAGQQNGYTLLDLNTGRFRAVDNTAKMIVELDLESDPARGDAPTAKVALQDKGDGPTIAGYPTRRYELTGDGEVCATYFLSKKALTDSGMRNMAESLRRNVAASAEEDDACDQAETYAVKQYSKLGIPLRELGMDGELVQEVTRIDTKAKAPPGGFSVPSGYKTVSMEQYIEQMMKQQKR